MALVDMIAEKDWDRAGRLAESIYLDCQVEAIEQGRRAEGVVANYKKRKG